MNKILLSCCLFFSTTNLFAEVIAGNFQLQNSKIEYLVKYLIKKAPADSTLARGKGECKNSNCEFLIGVPVKSFVSKDSNRDINMLNTTKAELHPMVVATVKMPAEIKDNKITANLEIDFAGVKKSYLNVPFSYKKTDSGFTVDGTFDLLLNDHKIEKPSLLGVDIENSVPISISAQWVSVK
jgi:hypothetical protein